ncbi:uncharacterized protein JCM15063_001554 [Sporobolomyces koalae]|uniref:uncharacterized protein n=1 Tax=Sporobolomyces koalae TaxID=500713 RepID=UPI003173B083
MASAVIRAMSFGALSSSSSDDHRTSRGSDSDPGGGPRSRSSSRTRNSSSFSRTLSRESTLELDDSLGLERSLSRLSLVSSGGHVPGGGILINPPNTNRAGSYETEPNHATSPPNPIATSLPIPSNGDPQRPARPIRTHSSASTCSVNEPLTPSSPAPPVTLASDHSAMPHVERQSSERKPKIKFAPLPQIRPRSYSTGRNVWAEYGEDGSGHGDEYGDEYTLDDQGIDTRGGLGGRHLVRREDGYQYARDSDEYDEEYDREGRDARRQSWTDTLGMGAVWGLANSKRDKAREIDEDAVSLGSSAGNASDHGLSSSGGKEKDLGGVGKILKPFLFGRKKSTPKKPVTADDDGTNLARWTSRDSQVSRKSISEDTPGPPTPTNQGTKPKGTTGIPMRKASTWDSTGSAGSKNSNRTAKRGNEDKDKNRRVQHTPSASSSLPRDPSTPQIIYYASPNRASRPTRRAQYPPVAQRSRTAPQSIRKSKVEEPEFSEWGSVGSVGSVSSRGKSTADEDDDGSGMAWIRRRRQEREEKERREAELARASADPTQSKSDDSVNPALDINGDEDGKENEVVSRAIARNPRRQSTIDSTFSISSSASTIKPASPKIMSGLSLSRPSEALGPDDVEIADDDASDLGSDENELEEEENVVSEDDSEPDEQDEEDEDEEADVEKEEDDDDLDAEELAREEALADAARKTARGAGAELYHSTKHESRIHVVDTKR